MTIENYDEQTGVNPNTQEQNTDNSDVDVAGQQQNVGEQSNERLVPLEVVQSIREENKEWKERARRLENYIYQQQNQQSQQQQQSQQSNDPLDQMDDEDLLTAGQARQMLQRVQQQSEEVVREVQMRQRFPDYDEVVTNELPELIEKKPYLRDAILSSKDPYNLAYELGAAHKQSKNAQSQQQQDTSQQQSQQQQQGQTSVESDSELNAALERNAQRPGSLSQNAAGSQGAVSQGDIYSGMSPMDFDEEIRRAKRGQ